MDSLHSDIWPEKELFGRNRAVEDVLISLVHCTQYCASFHLPSKSFPCHHFRIWQKGKRPNRVAAHQGSAQVAVAFSVRQQQRSIALEINMKPLSASGRLILWNILGLPSPSGRSMLYSGMHSRNSSSISTAFFSVNLTQWNMLNQLFYSHWKKMNLANSCRGLLPLVLAASADTLRIFDNEKYHEQISTVTSDLLSVRSTLAVFMWPSFTWKMPLVEQKGI